MAFWSGVTLAARLPKLIEGFDKKNIDCAAYTLRIGPAIYVSPSTSAEAATRTKVVLDERQDFVIPPGQFAFLLTEERVTVPSSAVAFISMKAGVKFKGLVNVSGFHVDPGYSGRLVFGVYNAGPATVHLARGDDCFLIWYASLDCESGGYVRQAPPRDEITSELITPVAGRLESLAGLSKRIDKVVRDHHVLRTQVAVAVTLGIGLFILGMTGMAESCQGRGARGVGAPAVGVSGVAAVGPEGAEGRPTRERVIGDTEPTEPTEPTESTESTESTGVRE